MNKIEELQEKVRGLELYKTHVDYELKKMEAEIFEIKNPNGKFKLYSLVVRHCNNDIAIYGEDGIGEYEYSYGKILHKVKVFQEDNNFKEVSIHKEKDSTFFRIDGDKDVHYYILNNMTENVEIVNSSLFESKSKWDVVYSA